MRLLMIGETGTDVMEVQGTLRKMGYRLPITGIYDETTAAKVTAVQRVFGLKEDGIVGPNTWKVLEHYMLGYDMYTVVPGDTIASIADKFMTHPWLIFTANNMNRSQRLFPGMRIKVPYDTDVVDTNINYDYRVMQRDLQGLQARYPFLKTGVIGNSVLGKNLYYIKLGDGPNTVMYNGSHHALEWITSVVMMKFVEDVLKAYVNDEWLEGFRIKEIWKRSSIYIIPMVNPDGVNLVLNGVSPFNPYYERLLEWNGNSADFSHDWQANIRGVDLNHNYDAMWKKAKAVEESYGVFGPGPTRFGGYEPESEPEVQAMVRYTKELKPRLVLAYHSQGEVIYYDFEEMASAEAKQIGRVLAYLSGYYLDQTEGIASYSGYKDWFIKEFGRPGYTVEVGKGKNPLPITDFDQIYRDNLALLLQASII